MNCLKQSTFAAARDPIGSEDPIAAGARHVFENAECPVSGGASGHYLHSPLTPALSPSAGEKANGRQPFEHPCALDFSKNWIRFSLSPAEGERAGVRGAVGGTVEMRPVSANEAHRAPHHPSL